MMLNGLKFSIKISITLCLLVTALELAGHIVYRFRNANGLDKPFVAHEIYQVGSTVTTQLKPALPTLGHMSNKVVHPFSGYVLQRDKDRVNSFGFDGQMPSKLTDPSKFRVAIVGGSVA